MRVGSSEAPMTATLRGESMGASEEKPGEEKPAGAPVPVPPSAMSRVPRSLAACGPFPGASCPRRTRAATLGPGLAGALRRPRSSPRRPRRSRSRRRRRRPGSPRRSRGSSRGRGSPCPSSRP
ncbi:hypothetical protein EAH89_12995 [Roseomonas nepalensis]|uniref:Uncharacterized protein n=1 Tax=Muricoccus nepalensis TaxID=1854500 RepID=A0A502G5Y6_9PROT|nr:hypothetical protein EAH89_12995 [Roseomonas nepalensis]